MTTASTKWVITFLVHGLDGGVHTMDVYADAVSPAAATPKARRSLDERGVRVASPVVKWKRSSFNDWERQLRRWAVDDAVNVLREEQPEHFAHNVANVGDATPGGLGMLATWLDRWMDDPVLDETKPSPRDRSIYCAAYTKALRAGIEACELGCEGDYDPDDVTEAAVEAAEGTL